MRIRKQTWLEMPDYIQITLHEPFWSAWKQYNWDEGIEGFGISVEAIRYGFKVDKKIRIVVLKYGKFEITPHMAFRRAKEHNSYYTARDGKKLVVIPRTACKQVEKPRIKILDDFKKEEIRRESIQQSLAL